MDWTRLVRERLRTLTGNPADDRAIVEELAQHLAQRFEERLAAIGARDALTETLAELGDPERLADQLRRARTPPRPAIAPPPALEAHMWTDLGQDLRFAVRLLMRSPGFAAAAILTVAIGIGATLAVFSVVDAVLLRPLPYPDASRLVAVWETDRDSGTVREPASLPDLIDFDRQARRLDAMGGLVADELTLTRGAGEPSRLAALYVTGDLLPLLGARAVVGRLFSPGEYASTSSDRILISDRLWARLFDRDPAAIGQTLRLDDQPRTIVGVLGDTADTGVLQWLLAADYSRGFADRDARTRVDLWTPLPRDPERLPRETHPVLVLGRLAPGSSLQAASEEMTAVTARLEAAYPENKARGAHLEPFTRVVLGPVRPALWVLLVAVGLMLLVACANVANLVLVKGTGRGREVAIRTALGAAGRRLTRQFVVENAVLAVAAAVVGLAVAVGIVRLLVALAPADVPRLATVALDRRALLLGLGATAVIALVFGLVPVWQSRHLDLTRALAADGGRAVSAGTSRGRLRSLLVVAEVALAVVLATGAGLMVRSLARLQRVDPGFQAAGLLKVEFQLPPSRYPADLRKYPHFVEMQRFNEQVSAGIAGLPGVQAVALAGNHPLDAGFTNSFTVVGREAEARHWPEISVRRVSASYFSTVGVPLVRGRLIRDGDDDMAAPVVLVNEAAARRFFEHRNPVGQQIRFWGAARTVVGIVGNERFHGLTEAPPPAVYAPLAQSPSVGGGEVLLVKSAQPLAIAGAVEAGIRRVDPGLAVFGVEPLSITLAESMGQRRFVMLLLATFAVVALALAAIGLEGVLSYDVAERRREIGIRLALGGLPARVVRLVMARALALTVAGAAVGTVAALGLTRLLRSLLFEVAPTDVPTFAGAVLVLVVVALAVSYVPARRAVQTDPAVGPQRGVGEPNGRLALLARVV